MEAELSGAGWQADGSESVAARELAQEHFGGNASTAIQVVVHSPDGPVTEGAGPAVLARATAMLEKDSRIADVVQPQPGATLRTGPRGRTSISAPRCGRPWPTHLIPQMLSLGSDRLWRLALKQSMVWLRRPRCHTGGARRGRALASRQRDR